jgi:hypothetical protein
VYDFQRLIFDAASRWPEATSLVVLGIGLLYLLQGFRFARFLLPVTCVGGGLVSGTIVASLTGLPPLAAVAVAGGLGFLTLVRFGVALKLASAFTFGALAQYLAVQLGFDPNMVIGIAIAGFAGGFYLYWVCRQSLTILVTILQGAGLLVVGFVGLTSALAPSLGVTFQEWAECIPLMVPTLMTMLCVLGYSVQANARRGDMETGGTHGLADPEAS